MCRTKKLIEDYMEEVVAQIEYIESTSDFDAQAKIKFFSDTRQSFGCSALVLQGGTALGKWEITRRIELNWISVLVNHIN